MVPYETVPHWIGLKVPAHDESTWRWANGLPVTHTSWLIQPSNVINPTVDRCFGFSKVRSPTLLFKTLQSKIFSNGHSSSLCFSHFQLLAMKWIWWLSIVPVACRQFARPIHSINRVFLWINGMKVTKLRINATTLAVLTKQPRVDRESKQSCKNY